jgi:DNA-binding response OmpR family regulator
MKRLIIVDDDPSILDVFGLVLSANYEVVTYADSIPILSGNFEVPDLFILDKQLSGTDGLDLCKLLKEREDTRHVPVIIVSASPGIVAMAKAAGADDVLEKPFRVKALRECIARQLRLQGVSGQI